MMENSAQLRHPTSTHIGICAIQSYDTRPWPLPTLRGTLNNGHVPTVELKTIFLQTIPARLFMTARNTIDCLIAEHPDLQ